MKGREGLESQPTRLSRRLPAVAAVGRCSSRGAATLLAQTAGPEAMHWSVQGAAPARVSRILLPKPGDGAQRSRLRVEGSFQTATEKPGHQPRDVTRWCPHATGGHDSQVAVTRSASARDLSSGDKDKAASPCFGRNLTERWSRRSRRSCQRPHTKFLAILPGRGNLLSRMRTQNFDAAGEAILEMGRQSDLTSQIR